MALSFKEKVVSDPAAQRNFEQLSRLLTDPLPSSTGIAATIVDAKGDLIVGTANDVVARQGVGADGQVLIADSTVTNGLKWAAAPGGAPTGAAGGALDGTYPNPGLNATVAGNGLAETADVLSINVDNSTVELNADALRVKALGITDSHVAAANKDGAAGTPSMRTLSTTATTACAGNDSRLSDSRPPNGTAGGVLDGSYPNPGIAAGVAGAGLVESPSDVLAVGAGTGVTVNANDVAVNYGSTGTTACVGNDSRLSDSRAPSGAASGNLAGTYPSPTFSASAFGAETDLTGTAADGTNLTAARSDHTHGWGVPSTINTAETFTVPTNRQWLFTEPITVDGTGALVVNGSLVDAGVDPSVDPALVPVSIGNAQTYVVPSNRQVLWMAPLSIEGNASLVVDGNFLDANAPAVF